MRTNNTWDYPTVICCWLHHMPVAIQSEEIVWLEYLPSLLIVIWTVGDAVCQVNHTHTHTNCGQWFFTVRSHLPPASAMKSPCLMQTQCVHVLQTIPRMIIHLNSIDRFVFAMQERSTSCQVTVTFEMHAHRCVSLKSPCLSTAYTCVNKSRATKWV